MPALETRIGWLTAVVGAVAALAALPWRPPAALGVACGAALSLVNYLWLRAGVEVLAGGGGVATVSWGMMRFLLRFALLGLCLYGIFISHLAPVAWVLAGLFAAPAAALALGVGQLIRGFRSSP